MPSPRRAKAAINNAKKRRTERFGGQYRVKVRSDFLRLQADGQKHYTPHFIVITARNQLTTSRLGITVSLKVDKRAVARNKLKRRLREIFRRQRSRLIDSYDIVIVARQQATRCDLGTIESEVVGALQQRGILLDEAQS